MAKAEEYKPIKESGVNCDICEEFVREEDIQVLGGNDIVCWSCLFQHNIFEFRNLCKNFLTHLNKSNKEKDTHKAHLIEHLHSCCEDYLKTLK